MDSVSVSIACNKYKHIVDLFFENNEKKLIAVVDKVLRKLKYDVDKTDFYSLSSEIFLDALCRYDGEQDFNGFLYSCLMNKFKTEMTRRNRQKRQADKMAISLEEKIGDDENMTIGDFIADESTIENEYFREREETYSENMKKYLSRLSKLQKEVLRLISIGFSPNEILDELHINKKIYDDCYNAIRSCRNTKILL